MAAGTIPGGGGRVRKCFNNEEAAITWARAKELEIQEQNKFHPVLSRFDKDQVVDAEAAFRMLNGYTMTQAADFFIKNSKPIDKEMPLNEAVEDFFWHKMDSKDISERSCVQLRSSLRLFARCGQRHQGPRDGPEEVPADDPRQAG